MEHIDNKSVIRDNPIQISPYYVCLIYEAFINESNIYITPKADGVTELLYDSETEITYDSEDIGDKNLIFHSYKKLEHHKSLADHIFFTGKMLSKFGDGEMLVPVNKISEIIDENKKYKCDNKYNVKKIFKINKTFFKDTFNDFLDLVSVNAITSFPCDGWIVFSDYFKMTFKLKPIENLTIDVFCSNKNIVYPHMLEIEDMPEINDTKVIRLKFNSHSRKWKFDKIRDDKNLANSNKIINEVMSYAEYNYNYKDCIIKYNETKNLYHKKQINDLKFLKLFNVLKENLLNILFSYRFDKILDLGCGKGLSLHYRNILTRYVGIDIDCTHYINSNPNDYNKQFIWGDMCSEKIEFFTNILTKYNKFDLILLNNTIYYALESETKFETLINNIKKLICEKGIVIISSFILDFMEELTKFHDITIKYVNKSDNIYEFCFPWLEKKIINTIPSLEKINYLAKKLNLDVKILDHIITDDIKEFDELIKMQKNIVLFSPIK